MRGSAADTLLEKFGDTINTSLGAETAQKTPHGTGGQPRDGQAAPALEGRLRNRAAGLLPIEMVTPDPNQPRQEFDEEELFQLAKSLQEDGQLQPVRVRWDGPLGKWVIVFGERRYRGAIKAGLKTLSCEFVEKELSPGGLLKLQLIENCLRVDLSPIELARAYQNLMAFENWTAKELAEAVHVSAPAVAKTLALLKLPEDLQAQVTTGDLPASAAYEIARVDGDDQQRALAAQVVEGRLTRDQVTAAVQTRTGKREYTGAAAGNRMVCRLETGATVTVTSPDSALSFEDVIPALETTLKRIRKAKSEELPFAQLPAFLKEQAGKKKKQA